MEEKDLEEKLKDIENMSPIYIADTVNDFILEKKRKFSELNIDFSKLLKNVDMDSNRTSDNVSVLYVIYTHMHRKKKDIYLYYGSTENDARRLCRELTTPQFLRYNGAFYFEVAESSRELLNRLEMKNTAEIF